VRLAQPGFEIARSLAPMAFPAEITRSASITLNADLAQSGNEAAITQSASLLASEQQHVARIGLHAAPLDDLDFNETPSVLIAGSDDALHLGGSPGVEIRAAVVGPVTAQAAVGWTGPLVAVDGNAVEPVRADRAAEPREIGRRLPPVQPVRKTAARIGKEWFDRLRAPAHKNARNNTNNKSAWWCIFFLVDKSCPHRFL
jgi:hypothetical protein